jgi:hypothetical protein
MKIKISIYELVSGIMVAIALPLLLDASTISSDNTYKHLFERIGLETIPRETGRWAQGLFAVVMATAGLLAPRHLEKRKRIDAQQKNENSV